MMINYASGASNSCNSFVTYALYLFQVVTSPILEYQTLLQRLFITTSVVEYRDVTVTRAGNDWY